MERMPRASRSATLSTLSFDNFLADSLSGTESVATTSVITEFSMRSTAGPERMAWVAAAETCVEP
jgi:hypothetical protein